MTKQEERERAALAIIGIRGRTIDMVRRYLNPLSFVYPNLKMSESSLRRVIKQLQARKLIELHPGWDTLKPYMYRRTNKGDKYLAGK